jgi:polyisoprenoid-binding protein YceI
MHRKIILAAVAVSPAVFIGPSLAAADKFVIDPTHVWISFSIQHNVWAKTLGLFRDVKGEILFDKDNVAASSVTAEIATMSIDTLDEDRDFEVKFGFLK